MRLKHRIEGTVLAVILLWQLSASALAVGAGTAAPFSWGSLALDGTDHRVICRTGQDALGDLDAVDPYGVRDDAALYALRFAAAPAAPEDRSGTAYDESQLITPVRAYDGPVVTFVAAARSTFLTAPAVPDGEDQPDSAAELFAARAIVPTLAVRPLSDALSAAELRQLASRALTCWTAARTASPPPKRTRSACGSWPPAMTASPMRVCAPVASCTPAARP